MSARVYNTGTARPLQASIEATPEDFAYPASCISKEWLQKCFYHLRANHESQNLARCFCFILLAIGHLPITSR